MWAVLTCELWIEARILGINNSKRLFPHFVSCWPLSIALRKKVDAMSHDLSAGDLSQRVKDSTKFYGFRPSDNFSCPIIIYVWLISFCVFCFLSLLAMGVLTKILLPCLWHQKSNSPIVQFMNLKCFKMPLKSKSEA